MAETGVLTAEFDGPNVKLTFQYPPACADTGDFSHSFVVERFDHTVTDDGNQVEVWTPIHTGIRKFVRTDVDYHMAYLPDGHPDQPYERKPGQQVTYRALAYRMHEEPNILHTEGSYCESVTI